MGTEPLLIAVWNEALAGIVDGARADVASGRELDVAALRGRIHALASEARMQAPDRVDEIEAAAARALRSVDRILAVERARRLVAEPAPQAPAAPAAPRPPRRAMLLTKPTVSGNMDVRRAQEPPPTLQWDRMPAVVSWEVRFSERPDPRSDYAAGDVLTLPGESDRVEIPLADVPLRVHVLGHSRDGRILRRAIVSGLTRETWTDRWLRRATAS